VPSFRDEDVRGLNVAVNYSFRVGGLQPFGNINRNGQQIFPTRLPGLRWCVSEFSPSDTP
jgi:hypothetical protein